MTLKIAEIFKKAEYGPSGTAKVKMTLDNGVKSGTTVIFSLQLEKQFKINISDQEGNILIHFNIRNDEKAVIMNSEINGWGKEERAEKYCFKSGQKYNFVIVHELIGYRIYVNGEEYIFYTHRCNNKPVLFETEGSKIFSMTYGYAMPQWAMHYAATNYNIQEFEPSGAGLPFVVDFNKQFDIGSCVMITGMSLDNVNKFEINIFNHNGKDINLHFCPRFSENCIIRNTRLCDVWVKEERDGGLPIKKGARFTIAFVGEEDGYRIFIDGKEFTYYRHRTPVETAKCIQVLDNIKLVKFIVQH